MKFLKKEQTRERELSQSKVWWWCRLLATISIRVERACKKYDIVKQISIKKIKKVIPYVYQWCTFRFALFSFLEEFCLFCLHSFKGSPDKCGTRSHFLILEKVRWHYIRFEKEFFQANSSRIIDLKKSEVLWEALKGRSGGNYITCHENLNFVNELFESEKMENLSWVYSEISYTHHGKSYTSVNN